VDLEQPAAWVRQEARLRELETIIAILVQRHGHAGCYTLPMDEAFTSRAQLLDGNHVVTITFDDDTLAIYVL
jgi:hypothetical protein